MGALDPPLTLSEPSNSTMGVKDHQSSASELQTQIPFQLHYHSIKNPYLSSYINSSSNKSSDNDQKCLFRYPDTVYCCLMKDDELDSPISNNKDCNESEPEFLQAYRLPPSLSNNSSDGFEWGKMTVGQLKKLFLTEIRMMGEIEKKEVCEKSDSSYEFLLNQVPLIDRSPLASVCMITKSNINSEDSAEGSSHLTFVLKEIDPKSSRYLGKGENSYYYAHSNYTTTTAVPEQWKPSTSESISNTVNNASSLPHNFRQSPFGTNIELYETLTRYSFEDYSDTMVKVSIPLEGVGKLEKGKVTSHFGIRQFEVLIHDFQAKGSSVKKNYRLGCSKTHAEIDVGNSKHLVRENKISLNIKKNKEGEVWFDLFKKKAIGDNDDPWKN